MHLSTLFSRAWQQKYLTPAERAIYKFIVALLVLVPSSLLLGGTDAALAWLHTSVPPLVWSILAVLIPALLLALAKYATARGDTAVGAIIQQIEQEAQGDITAAGSKVTSLGTNAIAPKPIVMPPPTQDQPKSGA